MGYLDGFAVTIRQHKLFGGKRVTTEYSGGRSARKKGKGNDPDVGDDEKIAKPERLHGRHVLNRYEDGMEKCIGCELCAGVCPAKCIYVRGADNDPEQPDLAGRAVRLRLRDQLPAVHPLRPVRRGLPDRGDHRVEAVRVLVHQPPGRDLHQDRAARRRRRQAAAACRGKTGATVRTCSRRAGCAPRRRRATPTFRGLVGWSSELGYGERAAEPPQAGGRQVMQTGRLRARVGDGARRGGRRDRRAPTRCTPRSRWCSRCSASPCTSSRSRRTSSPPCR